MSKSRSPRIGRYFLGAAFAVFVSVCLGGLLYLVVAMLLPELEIPPDESNHAAIGVGALVAFVTLLAQLWRYAMHRCLRPRRDFFQPSNSSDSSQRYGREPAKEPASSARIVQAKRGETHSVGRHL